MRDRSKIVQLRDLCLQYSPAALVLTETWLSEEIGDAEVQIPDYNLFRADRSVRSRGVHVFMFMQV